MTNSKSMIQILLINVWGKVQQNLIIDKLKIDQFFINFFL